MPHVGHVDAGLATRDEKLDERKRYLKSGILAFCAATAQHGIGWNTGSEALHADAWHQLTDSLPSLFNWLIVTLTLSRPASERRFRIGGSYAQIAFMLLAAGLILFHMEGLGTAITRNYPAVITAAAAATWIGWMRFRILHSGSPFDIFREFWGAVRRKDRINLNFFIEVIHVFMDTFFSIIAGMAGVAGLLGWQGADEFIPYFMAGLLILGAVLTLILTLLQGNDSEPRGCSSHH